MFMPPHIAGIIASNQARELRGRAAARARRRRRSRPRRTEHPALEAAVTIRLARTGDAEALRRLAELDSQRLPAGEMVVAALGDRLVAARSIEGDVTIADPFLHTAGLLALLDVRASQLRQAPLDLRTAPATRRRPAVAGDR